MTQELRKWALDKALEAGAGVEVVDVAKKILDFIGDEPKPVEAKAKPTAETVTFVKKNHKLGTLTKSERKILKAAVAYYKNGDPVKTKEIKENVGMSQPYTAQCMRSLIMKGYLKKKPKCTFKPLYDEKKQPVTKVVTVTKYPARAAVGYKGMTAPMGKVARIK